MTNLVLKDIPLDVARKYKAESDRYFEQIFTRLPPNTQRVHRSNIAHFYNFCKCENLPGLTRDFAATEHSIQRYVSEMCHSTLSFNTIKLHMATLSKFLKIARLPNPLKDSEFLREFIKLELQAHEIYQRANQAPALRLADIEIINEEVEPKTLLDIRDLAMINMMFDALLRADDVGSVQLSHIDYQKNKLFVPKSKADQAGEGSFRYLSNTTLSYVSDYISEANLDPKTLVEKPIDDPTRINTGILFRPLWGKGTSMRPYDESPALSKKMQKLDYTSIYRSVKRIAKKANLDLEITGHSPRVGGAVSMAEANISMSQIQKAGGWKSAEMPARYTEQAKTGSGMEKLAETFDR